MKREALRHVNCETRLAFCMQNRSFRLYSNTAVAPQKVFDKVILHEVHKVIDAKWRTNYCFFLTVRNVIRIHLYHPLFYGICTQSLGLWKTIVNRVDGLETH